MRSRSTNTSGWLYLVRVTMFLAVLLTAVPAAHAVLERMGPINPAPTVGSYPAWFQDKTGLTLEFCDLTNQAELNGGWCLLIPPAPATAPESFPNNYFGEHFYWAATNVAAHQGGTRIRFIMAVEGAFVNNAVIPGDQMTFGRIRLVMNPVPLDGDYTVYHPYGVWHFPGLVAGDRLFTTEDVGIACPGTFSCTLGTSIGPFLVPSAVPGGLEVPPIPDLVAGQDPFYDALVAAGAAKAYPATGKKYLADPGRIGPLTGSPLSPFLGNDGLMHDHNTLRIEGPGGFVMDLPNNFNVMGRVMTGQIPGKVVVDRASYTAAPNKLDVFASAFPTTQTRLPGQPTPPAVTPVIGYYNQPCGGALTTDPVTGVTTVNPPPYSAPVGGSEVAMPASGNNYWGQGAPPSPLPDPSVFYVCVEDYTARNAAGQVVPAFYLKKVTDDVSITTGTTPGASYDGPSNGTLTVKAGSSDAAAVLTLSGFGPGGTGLDLVNGVATVTGLIAPPAKIQVVSSFGGSAELPVTTGLGAAVLAGVPVANNDDLAPMAEDCQPLAAGQLAQPATACPTPLVITPLTNDTVGGGPIPVGAIITITQPPRIGTAIVNNADGTIIYTPNRDVNGTEGIGYTVTVNGVASNQAYITIPITPVNDAPNAVNDTTGALRGVSNSVNVLANDTDPDGAADLAAAKIETGNANLGLIAGTVFPNGVVTFTPLANLAAGPQTFTYRAQDRAGALSANAATVTVNVSTAEAIAGAKATYTQAKGRWVVSGTDSPAEGQTLYIKYNNGSYKSPAFPASPCGNNAVSVVGTQIGTASVDATGAWLLDFILGSTAGVMNPSNTGGNSAGFWCSPPNQLKITSSLSPAFVTFGISLK